MTHDDWHAKLMLESFDIAYDLRKSGTWDGYHIPLRDGREQICENALAAALGVTEPAQFAIAAQ